MFKKYAKPKEMKELKKRYKLLDRDLWSKHAGMSCGVLTHKLNAKSSTSAEQYEKLRNAVNKTIDVQIEALNKLRTN